jgi:Leu/Phe-tRNA-protein transferase
MLIEFRCVKSPQSLTFQKRVCVTRKTITKATFALALHSRFRRVIKFCGMKNWRQLSFS